MPVKEWTSSYAVTLNPPDFKTATKYVDLCLKCILMLVVLVAFVPLAPKLPAASLDASWALGLNQALAQGLSFGKDLIFTLGPYSSVYTKAYHPATAFLMLGGSLYLAYSYWFCLVLLMQLFPGAGPWPLQLSLQECCARVIPYSSLTRY